MQEAFSQVQLLSTHVQHPENMTLHVIYVPNAPLWSDLSHGLEIENVTVFCSLYLVPNILIRACSVT